MTDWRVNDVTITLQDMRTIGNNKATGPDLLACRWRCNNTTKGL